MSWGQGPADAVQAIPDEAVTTAEGSSTGSVIFGSEADGIVLVPPFPLQERGRASGWDTRALRALLAREYLLGAVLLRLEGYAVGVLQGDRLLDSRTGSRWIHGRNRKGGQSQRRFERTREKHIQELFDDACQAAQDKFTPYAARLDYLVLGGDRHTLQAFLKRCRFLQGYASRTLDRVLPIAEPKRATLERLPALLWQSHLLMWSGAAGLDALGVRLPFQGPTASEEGRAREGDGHG